MWKHKRETIIKMRRSGSWKHLVEILEKYKSGYAIMWLAREYHCDTKTIREILREAGIKKFRGRGGIRAWNKDKKNPLWQGAKNPNWKGGITPLIIRIRRCYEYKQWVKKIFERDNYTCQKCNKRGGNLQADHYPKMFCDIIAENKIKTFEEALNCKELWSLEGGRTLCIPCHRKTFKFKGNQFVQVKTLE